MTTERQSPSETLIKALEEIDGAEDVVIVWRKKDESGKDIIDWSINNAPLWRVFGLIETAKAEMLADEMGED